MTMIEAVRSDAEAGIVEEGFFIGRSPDGSLTTYAMGQGDDEMIYDMERAKLNLLVGADRIPYEEEDDG